MAGVWLLALAAGMVNVLGFLSFQHEGLSHLTGNTSLLGVAIADWDGAGVAHYAGVIGAFVAGCAITGWVVRDTELSLGWQEAAVLLGSALLLFLAPLLWEQDSLWGLYAAAAACGLQNSIVTSFTGSVVRTTHVSGMFTDLGMFLGRRLRGVPANSRRLVMSCTVISGFLIGGIGAALAAPGLEYRVLWIPGGICTALALACLVFGRSALSKDLGC